MANVSFDALSDKTSGYFLPRLWIQSSAAIYREHPMQAAVTFCPCQTCHCITHITVYQTEKQTTTRCMAKPSMSPARHSVVLNCKLVQLHNTCQSLPAVCYITSMW